MENDVVNGIISKLRDVFGEETVIYLDEVKQELSEPCFFVRTLEVSQELAVRNRYRRVYSMDIEYHPSDHETVVREIQQVADTLLMQLEYIHVGENLTRGIDIRYEVQDKVLHFFVDYDFFAFKVLDRTENMEDLIQTQEVKE